MIFFAGKNFSEFIFADGQPANFAELIFADDEFSANFAELNFAFLLQIRKNKFRKN